MTLPRKLGLGRLSPVLAALMLTVASRPHAVSGNAVQLCIHEQIPAATWPAETAEDSQEAWPFGLQPAGNQCLPASPTGEGGSCARGIEVWVLKQFNGVILKPLSLSSADGVSDSAEACKGHAYATPAVEFWQWRPESGCFTNEGSSATFPYPLTTADLEEPSEGEGAGIFGEFIQHYCPYNDTAIPVILGHQFRYVSGSQVRLPSGQPLDTNDSRSPFAPKLLKWEVPLGSEVTAGEMLATVSLDNQVVTIMAPVDGWLVKLNIEPDEEFSLSRVVAEINVVSNTAEGAPAPASTTEPPECPDLRPDLEHEGVPASTAGVFLKFTAAEGDCVEEGDAIAVVTTEAGEGVKIGAPSKGCLSALADLKKGASLSSSCPIALLKVPLPAGVEGLSFDNDEPVTFLEFLVEEGDDVDENATLARSGNNSGASTERRLRAISASGSGGKLIAPYDCHIEDIVDIRKGESVKPGQKVMYISKAKKYDGPPFPLILLLLLLLCCICLFCCCRSSDEEKPPEDPRDEAQPLVPPPVVSQPPPPPAQQPAQQPARAAPAPAPPPPPPPAAAAAPHQATPAAEPPKPQLKMVFEDPAGQTHEKRFEYHPLGIQFSQRAPITVSGFKDHSYARTQGVQKGWKIVGIGQHDVHKDHSYEHVDRLLLDSLKTLPPWPIGLVFERPDGSFTEPLLITRHTIGIQWQRHAPVKIEKVFTGSQAEALGIRPGWRIARISEHDVSHDHSISHVEKLLKESLQHLPQ
mmetsp:Transcript_28356/g.65719  ORF Transcript_28356/g.65719 Transcript_28356/m.65719 type:complete len:750 (+) Transcript_28356:81-2330(+)|eukprot:CAMPEP_0178406154 /NCGR_PEP_ID=MMETSP0689_2-20121128/18766_1 /TAXON_ID=160604 /ORGANISM="Amphidinium massartii, Strain CS-259" /LENGTH=749 /DNA_ID=CAMNT_0020027187 /DNA_START=21 /DNA_END=2270 /DNA_ORIENTATION=-